MLAQVQGRLGGGQGAEDDPVGSLAREGGQGPAAGDQDPGRGAHQLLGQGRQAQVPPRVLAGPGGGLAAETRLGLGFGFVPQVGLEVVQDQEYRLILEGPDQVAQQPLQALGAGEALPRVAVDGVLRRARMWSW